MTLVPGPSNRDPPPSCLHCSLVGTWRGPNCPSHPNPAAPPAHVCVPPGPQKGTDKADNPLRPFNVTAPPYGMGSPLPPQCSPVSPGASHSPPRAVLVSMAACSLLTSSSSSFCGGGHTTVSEEEGAAGIGGGGRTEARTPPTPPHLPITTYLPAQQLGQRQAASIALPQPGHVPAGTEGPVGGDASRGGGSPTPQ